jgi:hypothetical protein
VCGLQQPALQWGDDVNSPTFDICDCCGTEFGYEDCQLPTVLAQRRR